MVRGATETPDTKIVAQDTYVLRNATVQSQITCYFCVICGTIQTPARSVSNSQRIVNCDRGKQTAIYAIHVMIKQYIILNFIIYFITNTKFTNDHQQRTKYSTLYGLQSR